MGIYLNTLKRIEWPAPAVISRYVGAEFSAALASECDDWLRKRPLSETPVTTRDLLLPRVNAQLEQAAPLLSASNAMQYDGKWDLIIDMKPGATTFFVREIFQRAFRRWEMRRIYGIPR